MAIAGRLYLLIFLFIVHIPDESVIGNLFLSTGAFFKLLITGIYYHINLIQKN